jgi:hypothetical protein
VPSVTAPRIVVAIVMSLGLALACDDGAAPAADVTVVG